MHGIAYCGVYMVNHGERGTVKTVQPMRNLSTTTPTASSRLNASIELLNYKRFRQPGEIVSPSLRNSANISPPPFERDPADDPPQQGPFMTFPFFKQAEP
jgi:hypothetical protein